MFEDEGASTPADRVDISDVSKVKAPTFEFIAACDCYLTQLHYHRQKLVALGRCFDQNLCQKRITL
jgi:hypothetical protein